jgi:hypothetical protein
MAEAARLIMGATALAVIVVQLCDSSAPSEALNGNALRGLQPFDDAMVAIIHRWNIPAAGLAVARGGQPQ